MKLTDELRTRLQQALNDVMVTKVTAAEADSYMQTQCDAAFQDRDLLADELRAKTADYEAVKEHVGILLRQNKEYQTTIAQLQKQIDAHVQPDTTDMDSRAIIDALQREIAELRVQASNPGVG